MEIHILGSLVPMFTNFLYYMYKWMWEVWSGIYSVFDLVRILRPWEEHFLNLRKHDVQSNC
jgi:hypothetical protein